MTDWKWTPPEPQEPEPEPKPESEPRADDEAAAAAETPTVSTEPTDWFDPPPVESVETDAVLPPETPAVTEAVAQPEPSPEPPPRPEPAEAPAAETVEPTDWLAPPPLEPAPVVDEPVYERTEPEIIEVPASEDIEEVIEEADEDEDEIVFDLASLSSEERRHLSMRLNGANISHIWEVATDLVVSVKDADVIETYVEEVRNPEGFGDDELAAFDEDSDVDDEEIYAAMSNLYVAADKLMQKPGDDALAGNFYLAADDVEGLPAPFGFDPRVWQQVLGLTESIVAALDAEGDPDAIGSDATTLRQLLVNYV